jgi:hypothetical protein
LCLPGRSYRYIQQGRSGLLAAMVHPVGLERPPGRDAELR